MANEDFTEMAVINGTPSLSIARWAGGQKAVTLVDTIAALAPATGGTVAVFRIPVEAIITSIMLANDDLGTTTPGDLGFYRTVADGFTTGGTAVDSNALATAIALGTAQTSWVEYRFEVLNINTAAQTAWELAGLSARPDYGMFDIVITYGTVTAGAAGDISAKMTYIQ